MNCGCLYYFVVLFSYTKPCTLDLCVCVCVIENRCGLSLAVGIKPMVCVCVCLITSRGNSCSEYGPNVCVCVCVLSVLAYPPLHGARVKCEPLMLSIR